jgi:hypothetical protein
VSVLAYVILFDAEILRQSDQDLSSLFILNNLLFDLGLVDASVQVPILPNTKFTTLNICEILHKCAKKSLQICEKFMLPKVDKNL